MKCEEASQKKDCALTTAAYLHSASSTPPSRPHQQQHPVPLPATNNGIATAAVDTNGKYRDDELTGMAGLMELASPPDHQTTTARNSAYEYNSTRTLANSNQHAIPPALNITQSPYMPQQQLQPLYQYYQSHSNSDSSSRYQMQHNSATTLVGMLTPENMPHKLTRSFPATVDDIQQVARRRSQSTDSFQHNSSQQQQQPATATSALPYVLNNANIRNRSHTSTQQRQRTSDTPLFPILLHRIINDPQNAPWIRWCEDGTAFKFSSAENLLSCLQNAGLRAQNYHSIEKNLNDYRFTRLTDQRRKIPDLDGKLWWMFSHPQFLRDTPDGIVGIQRRRRTTNLSLSSSSPQNSVSQQRHQQPPHNPATLIYAQQPPPLPPPQQPGSWM